MDTINWTDFEQIDLRSGTIIEVLDFPEARKPAWRMNIDFGPGIGVLHSTAQITKLYDKESLIGKQVIAVVNFPPKQIGPVMSQCLVCGFHRADGAVVLAVPDKTVSNGVKLG